jgi:hypothetical protein
MKRAVFWIATFALQAAGLVQAADITQKGDGSLLVVLTAEEAKDGVTVSTRAELEALSDIAFKAGVIHANSRCASRS